MMTPAQRRRRLQEMAQRVVDRLDREWPAEDAHLNDLEDLAQRVGQDLMQELTQELIRERASRRQGNQSACSCGALAAYKGEQELTLVTAQGRVTVQRAYFYCEGCRQGHCPLDQLWGLGPAHSTPTVQSWVAALAAVVSYRQVPLVLRRLGLPIHLGLKSVELITQQLGQAVAQAPPQVTRRATRPLAVAVDETMLPTHQGYKAARCGVVYEPDWQAPRTPSGEAELRKEYVGTLGSREALLQEVCQRVARRRPTPHTLVAALGDGAPWIWEGFAAHLPQRVEILDFYHVCEHLTRIGAAWHGDGSSTARAWVQGMQQQLRTAGPQPLLRALQAWQPGTAAAREVQRQELGYFQKNQQRMNYPQYLRDNWPIGSGAIEGTCKHLVAERFKGTGMRWQAATAEPLLHLRAALLTQPDLNLRAYLTGPATPYYSH